MGAVAVAGHPTRQVADRTILGVRGVRRGFNVLLILLVPHTLRQ